MRVIAETNILGSEWTITAGTPEEYTDLVDCDGYCDSSTREIIVLEPERLVEGPLSKKNASALYKRVVRHEIVHAYFEESGLAESYEHAHMTGIEETIVDWFAIQAPKIFRTFAELDVL